jgi:homoserine dehydrogenase
MQHINLGIIGGGTVGGGVYEALQRNGSLLASRIGARINVHRVAVRDSKKKRTTKFSKSLLTNDWREVVFDPEVQLVAELVGGTTTAKEIVLSALKLGKPVITANKALLSAHGEKIFAAAKKYDANLYYEASVCGGIPIIKSLREGFVGNRITSLYGIVNGTCNFILSRMKLQGEDYTAALAEAQRMGYAETPPDLDVDGHDAAHKIGILASLAHGFWVNPDKIFTEGIRHITPLDIKLAGQLGYTIKLLGIIKKLGPGSRVQVIVHPALVPNSHVMASVNDVYNAVLVRGDVVGDTLFYGQGAGKNATASAVLSDLADAALDLRFENKHRVPPFVPHECDGSVAPIAEVSSEYFIRLNVLDKPGVLARIASIFARSNISISLVMQPRGSEGELIPLVLMLHRASNGAVSRALRQISGRPLIQGKPVMLRVEKFE